MVDFHLREYQPLSKFKEFPKIFCLSYEKFKVTFLKEILMMHLPYGNISPPEAEPPGEGDHDIR